VQDAVNAVFHGDFRVARFDMNVTGAALECSEDDSFDEFYDGARSGVPRNAIAGERLVALFLRLADLKSESFGCLFENALGLLGALEQVSNLTGRGRP